LRIAIESNRVAEYFKSIRRIESSDVSATVREGDGVRWILSGRGRIVIKGDPCLRDIDDITVVLECRSKRVNILISARSCGDELERTGPGGIDVAFATRLEVIAGSACRWGLVRADLPAVYLYLAIEYEGNRAPIVLDLVEWPVKFVCE
jgi:hypothetical protein